MEGFLHPWDLRPEFVPMTGLSPIGNALESAPITVNLDLASAKIHLVLGYILRQIGKFKCISWVNMADVCPIYPRRHSNIVRMQKISHTLAFMTPNAGGTVSTTHQKH